MDKFPMTLDGYERLEAELKRLKTTERPAVIKAIAAAREHGDLSENAEYHAARERQAFVEGRVSELEEQIRGADVIDARKLKGKDVKFGAIVKVADEDTDEKTTFQIVGEYEADIKAGRLAITSPLARALIGKRVNDSVEVMARREALMLGRCNHILRARSRTVLSEAFRGISPASDLWHSVARRPAGTVFRAGVDGQIPDNAGRLRTA